METEDKKCSKCNIIKCVNDFSFRGDGTKKRKAQCKKCRSEWEKILRSERIRKKDGT